ncbi:alpha-1,2-fucosyltransferase [Mucilaginibacter ginsenosidivorans]|uniref:alpha-1,2-fucosyltransferase n=1 Tax=Mucilaginibacter ginsenosidivorans TaxID=398053 RepID=UPI0035E7FB1B
MTRLQGGLGNQMFQYAAALKLAVSHGTKLYLDTRSLSASAGTTDITPRRYALDAFHVSAETAPGAVLDGIFEKKGFNSVFKRIMNRRVRIYREGVMAFDTRLENIRPPVYLDGYWQSEKYFIDIEPKIRAEFSFSENLLSAGDVHWLNRLKACESVAVHVRRGDYISSVPVRERHGVCGAEYYEDAMRLLNERFAGLNFFIFSDEPPWVKEQMLFRAPGCYIVDQRPAGSPDGADLYLMSNCRHHIIANSTYSWWAAWLNGYEEKVVIAPKNWFKVPPDGFKPDDLIPEKWIKL